MAGGTVAAFWAVSFLFVITPGRTGRTRSRPGFGIGWCCRRWVGCWLGIWRRPR
jgi:hypothetical protein